MAYLRSLALPYPSKQNNQTHPSSIMPKNTQAQDDHDVESGESTPLLARSSEHDACGTLSAPPVDYLGTGAVAPPPAAAPPPPPETSTHGNDTKHASSHHEKQSSATSSSQHQNNDDNASLTAHSTKSGKSGKTSKKKKKKSSSDAASTKSGKSTNKSSNKQAKKKIEEGPQKSICHLLFDSVRYLAIIASCMMFTIQIVPLMVLGGESTWLQISVRSYLAIFCLSFILTESHIPFLQRIVLSSHNNWILRGFLYSFIGLIGMEQDLAVKVEDIAAGTFGALGPDYGTLFATLYMSITTWLMIGVGILYTALGLLCLQGWYERLEKDHIEKVREYRQKKKRDADFRKQKEDYKQYEKDRHEGRGEWYDDIE